MASLLTFAWETEAFRQSEQVLFGRGGLTERKASWPWILYESIRTSGVFGDWIIGGASLPVGPGIRPTVVWQGNGLPPVVQTRQGGEAIDVPGPIDKRDIAQNPTTGVPVSQTLYAKSPEQYAKLVALYPNNKVVKDYGTTPATPGTGTMSPGWIPSIGRSNPPVSDLGTLALDLLGQAGSAYIQRELGPQPVGYAPPAITAGAGMLQNADIGLPFVDVVPEAPDSCGNYVYKKSCGQWKWVKQRRRRRKRLATKSDLSDLASLKGILGQGKAFEVWIATHS